MIVLPLDGHDAQRDSRHDHNESQDVKSIEVVIRKKLASI
jgi:hypothetical protein